MRADARDRQLVRDAGGDVSDLVEGYLVEQRDRAVGVDVLAVDDRLLRGVAGDRAGVLERDRARAGGVGAGALDLGLGSGPRRGAR